MTPENTNTMTAHHHQKDVITKIAQYLTSAQAIPLIHV